MTKVKRKSLVGYTDTNWQERFRFFFMKPCKDEHKWIYELRRFELSTPLIYSNKRPITGCVQPYPFCDKRKKVRITIQEI